MIQRTALLTLVAAAALAVAGVAHAKGPSKASVTGPALNGPLAFAGSGEDGGSSPLGRLTEDAGFFPAVFGQEPNPMLAGRPGETLGPRYTITYTVPGLGGGDTIRQVLYPYAAGGSLTYMSPGQRFWGTQRTRGGWYRGSGTLKRTLVSAGLPARPPKILAKSGPAPSGASGLGGSWPFVIGGVVALALIAAGALAVVRRRPWPVAR